MDTAIISIPAGETIELSSTASLTDANYLVENIGTQNAVLQERDTPVVDPEWEGIREGHVLNQRGSALTARAMTVITGKAYYCYSNRGTQLAISLISDTS